MKRLSIALLHLLFLPGLLSETFTKGKEQKPLTPQLKAGDYVWKPEISPSGPVVIIVSLQEQKLYVYRNGVRIGRSTISSGKSGHRTPTGVFTILEKNVKHVSSIYRGASMPYMERLTWGGIAMHAGNLPGYPASHGCVRLPVDFAQKLYTVTSKGTTVVVTDGRSAPGTTSQPGLLLSGKLGERAGALPPAGFIWQPEKAVTGPVSVILSSADRRAYVYRNGLEIGRAAIGRIDQLADSYAYSALAQTNSDGTHEWSALGSAKGSRSPDLRRMAKQLVVPPEFLNDVRGIVGPGTTLILTNQPVDRSTKSGPGFKILTTETPAR